MDKSAFTAQYREVAAQAASKLGTDPDVLLAQWGLETGWGKSIIPGTNNLGNIKAGKSWSGPTQVATDNATKATDPYRSYANSDEFVNDYVSLIQREYPKAVGQTSAAGFAGALKAGGYAEDPEYVNKIVKIVGDTVVGPTQPTKLEDVAALIDRGTRMLFNSPGDAARSRQRMRDFEANQDLMHVDVSPLAWVGSAIHGNTTMRIIRGIEERLFGPDYPPEEGFKPELGVLPPSADESTFNAYHNAQSKGEADHILQRFENEQLQAKALMSRGVVPGMIMGFAGEIAAPTSWVTPFAVTAALAKAGRGALTLARQGRAWAAVGSAVGENLLSGTAMEAIAQGLQGQYRPGDLAMSLVTDGLMGGVVGGLTVRQANLEHGIQLRDAAIADVVAKETVVAQRVQERLGPGATVEEVRRAMDEELLAEAKAVPREAIADLLPAQQLAAREPKGANVSHSEDTGVWMDDSLLDSASTKAMHGPGQYLEGNISKHTGGKYKTLAELESLPSGIHVIGDVPYYMRGAVSTLDTLAKKFMGNDYRITLRAGDPGSGVDGKAVGKVAHVSEDIAMITLDPNMTQGNTVRVAVHEVGHVIFSKYISKVSPEQYAQVRAAFDRFIQTAADKSDPNGNAARAQRYSLTSPSLRPDEVDSPKLTSSYELSWNEFSAEQFVKFMEADVQAPAPKLGLRADVIAIVKQAIARALEFLKLAKKQNLGVTDEYKEFFETILNRPMPQRKILGVPKPKQSVEHASISEDVVNELLLDPVAQKYGINLAPMGTPAERKQAQAMVALYKQAEEWERLNPMDEAYKARAKNLSNSAIFGSNLSSTGLLMLSSPNPLVRMMANRLVEDSSGVVRNKNATAAISKVMTHRLMLGNAVNDFGSAFDSWKVGKVSNAQGLKDDLIGGRLHAEFNKLVAAEIEARTPAMRTVSQDPNVVTAANVAEAALTRSANEQKRVKTLGWEALGDDSIGYLPHRMNAMSVINLTNEKRAILHQALTDQFVTISGWDMSFADTLASRYLERVSHRASGDYGSNIGGGNTSTASLVQEALQGMNLPADVIEKHMKNFQKGAANYTKTRIKLDLNRVYPTADGDFKLLDIFETDVLNLVRAQIGRASGEVALTKFGVQGKPGLKLLRDAMEYGADGARAGNIEKEAFDQVAAEFMEEPFGTALGKWGERALMANAAVRLGGNVMNQLGESINAVFTLGLTRALDMMGSLPAMRKEIIALSKGQAVNNPWLTSVETLGGKEFGTDAYKIVMPYDNPNSAYPAYGRDSVTSVDRILRGVGHAQGIISGWRWLHSAQQRGVAQQIVMKLGKYLREGADDVALKQMGFTDDVQAALRADGAFTYDLEGRATGFDATRITDAGIREQTIQAVHRGTAQIIQDTFIGERGKWVHDGWLRLLTQFRGFGIVSMEKQWGRGRNTYGPYAAFGMMVGAMSMAVPLHMARVYAASIGRPDAEEYIEKNTTMQHIARSTLNYIGKSGLSGDFMDLLSAVAPEEFGMRPTGGRVGAESDFVGNYVAPASSLVDDIFKYAQSPTNLDELARLMPFSRVPYLLPFVNTTRE